jgi:hypothetical protein
MIKLLSFLFLLTITYVQCDFYFTDIQSLTYEKPIVVRVLGMYRDGDRAWASVVNGESYIRMTGELDVETHNNITGNIEVAILQTTNLNNIGYGKYLCCTNKLMNSDICNKSDTLIIKYSDIDVWTSLIPLHVRNLEGDKLKYNIQTTGEHIMIISHCSEQIKEQTIEIKLNTEWKNPYGYLPGRLYGFLPFHKYMLLLYIVVGFLWLLKMLTNKEIISLQIYISIVIFLCAIEQFVKLIEYPNFNVNGIHNVLFIMIILFIISVRSLIFRVLLVTVCIGSSMVKQTFSRWKYMLTIFSIFYFLSDGLYELLINDVPLQKFEHWRIYIAATNSILNAIWYSWIFLSMYHFIIESRSQLEKLQFINHYVLFTSICLLIFTSCYQIYFQFTNQFLLHWSYLWLLEGGFSFILYTIILFSIASLFRPNSNASRYAYAAVQRLDYEDEFGDIDESIELPPGNLGVLDEDDDVMEMNNDGALNTGTIETEQLREQLEKCQLNNDEPIESKG